MMRLSIADAKARVDSRKELLELIEAILNRGDLRDYHLAHSARAELCRRLGRREDARQSYERALALTRQEPERRFLRTRLSELK
jgi:RNA polymerase sigma-70 factor (ECF subfamily)